MALDQKAAALPDVLAALRDAMDGAGIPAKWVRSEITVQQISDQHDAALKAQATLTAMGQGADIASTLASAKKDAATAGTPVAA